MADDENRALEGFQLFREPLELFLTDVRGIAALVVLRFLVAVEDDQVETVDVLGVVAPLHSPELGDLVEGVSTIDLVVAENVQGSGVGFVKGLGYCLVFLCRIGEVAELQQGVGHFFLHGIDESLQSRRTIVHNILVQVGDHAELDGLFDFPQTGHDLPGKDDRGRRHTGGKKEVTS